MKNFAPQSYYDTMIAKAIALGYRLVAQVQISTDDLPYHVPVTAARVTCITLDIPGKALFVNLYHDEHAGFLGDGYANNWSTRLDFDLGNYGALLTKLQKQKGWQQLEDIFQPVSDVINEPIDNLQDGWAAGNELQRTFTGDVVSPDHEVLCSLELVESVLGQFLTKRATCYTAEKFEELMVFWQPHYVFAGGHLKPEQQEREKKLSNIYWERFGAGRKILREKIAKMH